MINKEIRRAKQRKDWDTVQKLLAIQQAEINLKQSKLNLHKTQKDIEMIEFNKKVAEKSLDKMAVDVDKTLFDRNMAWWNWLFGSGLAVLLVNSVKDLPIIKQFFNK